MGSHSCCSYWSALSTLFEASEGSKQQPGSLNNMEPPLIKPTLASAHDALNSLPEEVRTTVAGDDDCAAAFLLSAVFWRALKKARGWPEEVEITHGDWDDPKTWSNEYQPSWMYYAFRYFETCLSKKDEKEFWKSLP